MDDTLIVPIQLDAMVVNSGVLSRDTFRWWQMSYQALGFFKSPEPAANGRGLSPFGAGIYLSWSLPLALRTGTQQSSQSTAVGYNLVPNRWLIVRMNGTGAQREAVGWVLESDCPSTSLTGSDLGHTSPYLVDPPTVQMWKNSSDTYRNSVTLDPASNDAQCTNIGIPFPLTKTTGWSERASQTMFLTAVAPANPVFSIYYPHKSNVFSFYDDLSDIVSGTDTLSYLVMGWFSDPSQDILAPLASQVTPTATFADLLSSNFQWTLEGDQDQTATSMYQGMTFAIPWDADGDPPSPDPLATITETNAKAVNIAVGNTTTDAFTALIASQLSANNQDPSQANLFRAFQYDMLPILNQVNGDALLEERIRQEWFGSTPGGYVWTIVSSDPNGSAPVLTSDELAMLTQLNTNQVNLDNALKELFASQWQLNALWYRQGFLAQNPPPEQISDIDGFNLDLSQQLNPEFAGTAEFPGTAAAVLSQIASVQNLLSKVPQPDWTNAQTAQEAYQSGITAFATANGLDSSKTLKSVPAPRYWQANNPVVLISGLEPSDSSDPDETLTVRMSSDLVTTFNINAVPVSPDGIVTSIVSSLTASSTLPGLVPALIGEFFFLDPGNAAAIAQANNLTVDEVSSVMNNHNPSDYNGSLPDLDLGNWQQPWQPMYLEWELTYDYIPWEDNSQNHWAFDGTDYSYSAAGGAPTIDQRQVGGISLLSPHTQFVFQSRLENFIQTYGSNSDLENLDTFISATDQWQFLAQELTGLNESLALRDSRAYRRPSVNDTIGDQNQYPLPVLIGYGDSYTANSAYSLPDNYNGQVNSIPYIPDGVVYNFHGTRQGQFYVSSLFLYDNFGRVLSLIESVQNAGIFSAQNFPLIIDSALQPKSKVESTITPMVELAPRLLQGGRLDITLLDQTNDQLIYSDFGTANPICGWVLPNHLDNSILLYAPDGTNLGEFRLVESDQGTQVGEWQPPPHSDIATLDDVGQITPHLQQMLAAPQFQVAANFQAFLDAIDATLWTIDPLGNRGDQNLAVLIGRPLALVRASLALTLDGPFLTDQNWAATFAHPTPEFMSYDFAVRLGDQATRDDGVIGYFLQDNYAIFNSVVQADQSQSYVQQIGPLGGSGNNYISLQFGASTATLVTLLVDPRASIHATTGIFPVMEIDVPAQLVAAALANIEVTFHINPILTPIQQTPAQGGVTPAFPQAISYPSPAEQNGTWSWWESDAASNTWAGYDLIQTTPNVQLQSLPISLREGFLQFVLNLDNES